MKNALTSIENALDMLLLFHRNQQLNDKASLSNKAYLVVETGQVRLSDKQHQNNKQNLVIDAASK